MQRILQLILYPLIALVVLFVAYTALSAPAHAQASDTPLVVIRFNQARVYYDQQLFNAIAKAVDVKPGVLFDVIAYSPVTGDSGTDAAWQQTASSHTRTVVANMQKMGVPLSRISVSGQPMQGIRYDETHVFVR